MQFIDLAAQYAQLKNEIDDRIKKVLTHGRYIMGPEVAELEGELCRYTKAKHCLTCANGTDALVLALMAWGVGPGDAVFVPSFTFAATAEAVCLCGAEPVFVDIDEETFNIDTEKLEHTMLKISGAGRLNLKAVIPVDLFGQPAEHVKIERIAKKYGLKILEDGAQGFGGAAFGKKACSFGDAAATSFFPAKPLGCYGDGGAVFTNDDETADILRSLRVHGKGNGKYDNVRIGQNSRLDTLQAAILLPKLKAFEQYELDMRQKWADCYSELLSESVKTPLVKDGYSSSWAQYTVMLKDEAERDAVCAALTEAGIPSMIYYKTPLHMQKAYDKYESFDMAVSEAVSKRVLSLPMHPYLDEETVEKVCECIKSTVKQVF